MATLEDALAEITKNNRVCPLPQRWNQLYELLPNRSRKGGGWEPALPLILAAWHETPALMKIARLREHIEWAAANGAIDKVQTFLASLSENDWYHLGE